MQSKAKQSKAKAMQIKAKQSKAKESKHAKHVQFNSWQELRTAQSVNEQSIRCCIQHVALYMLFEELQRFKVFSQASEIRGVPAATYFEELASIIDPLPFGTPNCLQSPHASSVPATSAMPGTPAPGGTLNAGAATFVPTSSASSTLTPPLSHLAAQ